jgi:hypothetical protein
MAISGRNSTSFFLFIISISVEFDLGRKYTILDRILFRNSVERVADGKFTGTYIS